MKAPILEENKCSLVIAKYSTGHVMKKDLTIFSSGENEQDVFQVFDNLNTAKEFALQLIKSNPEFECSILNHNGVHLVTFDITGER